MRYISQKSDLPSIGHVLRAWRFRHDNARNYAANLTPYVPYTVGQQKLSVSETVRTRNFGWTNQENGNRLCSVEERKGGVHAPYIPCTWLRVVYGAILAHIPPLPSMAQLAHLLEPSRLYQQNIYHFSLRLKGSSVAPCTTAPVALPAQRDIMGLMGSPTGPSSPRVT